MIKKLIITLLLAIILIPTSLHANNDISSLVNNWFVKFSQKISYRYSDSQEIAYFEKFSTKLNYLLATKNFNEAQIKIVDDVIKLSNERVFKIKRKNEESQVKNKLNTNDLLSDFKYFLYNPEKIFLEN